MLLVGNNFILNCDHPYYDQLQGQIFMTKTASTILIEWTKILSSFKKFKDDACRSTDIDMLLNFFFNKFIPFILSKNTTL